MGNEKILKKKILLGSISIIHSNWLPYAAGCLISYCNRIEAITQRYEFHTPIYKHKPVEYYRDLFLDTDILGLTCYVWNQSYNDELSKYFKSVNPNGIVIYGGPQIPERAEEKLQFDAERDWVDCTIAGLGEIAFAEWLQDLEYSNATLKTMPTPYTDGVFDSLLNTGEDFKVSFETNRGCPYSCAFCDWGGQSKSKLTKFDINKVYETIDYIYKFKNISELEILDANFGILKQDIDIIDYMIAKQNENDNYLKISYSGLAKNGSKNLPIILQKIFDNVSIDQRNLKLSFQTHTPEVLEIINRSNIDNSRLLPLINEYKANNIPTTSEMIIALPGETADSWLKTLHYNYHTLGIDYVRTYFLHLVSNIDMSSDEYKERYGIKTKIIKIGHQEFEIIHRCMSYDLDELVKMFDYHWFYHNLINTDLLKSHINNVYEDCLMFFEQLENMPTLSVIVEKNRDLVRRIFSDTQVTELHNSLEQRYFSSSLRTNDLEQIIKNHKHIEDELFAVFGYSINSEWKCDSPKSAIAIIT